MEKILNKFLLLLVMAMAVTAANAQLSETRHFPVAAADIERHQQPLAVQQEMQMATSTDPAHAPSRADGNGVNVYYNRPAGAFSSVFFIKDGQDAGMSTVPYLFLKPYIDYTFTGVAEGVSGQETYIWGYDEWNSESEQYDYITYYGQQLIHQFLLDIVPVPILTVMDEGNYYTYQYGQHNKGSDDGTAIYPDYPPAQIIASPTIDLIMQYFQQEEGLDMLMSSKTFLPEGHTMLTYYSGANPFGDNAKGWWFGKNAGSKKGMPVNGIAQAFEKPTTPYLLKSVVMEVTGLQVSEPTRMTCKIYRLDDGIPAYTDGGSAILDDKPGELIGKGHATLSPQTSDSGDDLITFTLFGEEYGLEYEIELTVDDAILVVIDGYNDPEMDGLTDFSALISSNMHQDEGFGELAYLRCGIPDEDGNYTDKYQWMGLNNFFGEEMKTGFTIFLTIDNPYLTFNYKAEDGQFIFPPEGGVMKKEISESVSTRSIEFYSWYPSVDGDWTITSGNDDELPDWLDIELVDGETDGDFNHLVTAIVTADPLPKNVRYREAVVTFSTPGANIKYLFRQSSGSFPPPQPNYDLNGDGEINIADVNYLIDIIISDGIGVDFNHDGECNFADLMYYIDVILLGGHH